MNDAQTPSERTDIAKALHLAFLLGQTYWQQADSESYSENKKANATFEKFRALADETVAALSAPASSGASEAVADLEDVLRRHGFVPCDIPACNCGSWHARYGLPERMDEIKDMLSEAGHPLCNDNGNLVGNALRELIAERDRLSHAKRAIEPATSEKVSHAETARQLLTQCGWIDEFGNVFPMGTWGEPTKRTWHDGYKEHWQPIYRATDAGITEAQGATP